MSTQRISNLFNEDAELGSKVQIQGWIRTKRDSKAGFSFLAIHDGSSFDPIQAIVPNTLSNYQSEVLALSTGCSVTVIGTLKESEGRGQAVEIEADSLVVEGWVDDPESYPIAKKTPLFRVSADGCASAAKNQYLWCDHPG